MEVIGTEWSSTLGALAQSGLIALFDALRAEHMETLGQYCVLLTSTATRTVQLSLHSHTHTHIPVLETNAAK